VLITMVQLYQALDGGWSGVSGLHGFVKVTLLLLTDKPWVVFIRRAWQRKFICTRKKF